MSGGNLARDGRATMRIVFANTVENILKLPGSPNGRIPDSTTLAMRLFEATALPWIRQDAEFTKEIEAGKDLKGDILTLHRWSAVLAGLMRARMLDHATVPWDKAEPGEDDA